MNYKVIFPVILYVFSFNLYGIGKYASVIFNQNQSSQFNDEERALIEEAAKKLTAFGFISVQKCVLSSVNCNAYMISDVLKKDENVLLSELKAHFIYLNDDRAQKLFAYENLSSCIRDEFIEDIFEKHPSSIDRANAFVKELVPLLKKLSKLFLAHKISLH